MASIATAQKPCYCSSFEFGNTIDLENGDVDFVGHDTECDQTTKRTFAMGHDAKLAGYLVRAELAGLEIRLNANGVFHTFGSAVQAAATVSEALAAKVERGMQTAIAKASKPSRARKAKVAQVEPEAPTTREAKIKVGRWTYKATIDLATNEATYTSKLGIKTTVIPSKWSEVA